MFKIFLALLLMTQPAWATTQWRNGTGANTLLGTSNASDIDTNTYNNMVKPLDNLLANYHQSMSLHYDSASQITASLGSVTVSNSDGSIRLMLYNSTNTTVTWADIDTGAEASGTTYYVYAIAASASATAATFKISANSTSPSGITYWKKIGSFYNDGSSNIDRSQIFSEPYGTATNDASGAKMVTAIYDYASSSSSFTNKTGALKIAYGSVSVGASSSASITNLPFSSSSSYSCTASQGSGAAQVENVGCVPSSGSALTINNNWPSGSTTVYWMAVGI